MTANSPENLGNHSDVTAQKLDNYFGMEKLQTLQFPSPTSFTFFTVKLNYKQSENRGFDFNAVDFESYEYGMSVEEMLKSNVPMIKAIGVCIRDAYEAGLRGDKIPMKGKV